MLPIRLRGAKTHNLRSVDLDLAPGELVALTGRSGSGKSSLALDTLYAEGQRRFVESFSPYARQFLERLERPPVESLNPIAATVAIDRKAPVKSSRSTLATLADLESYLAALFACDARPVCPKCNVEAVETSGRETGAKLANDLKGARAYVAYALPVTDRDSFLELRDTLIKDGYRRLIIDGTVREIDEVKPSETTDAKPLVVVDRLIPSEKDEKRIAAALEAAWERGGGRAEIVRESESGSTRFAVTRGLSCPSCARSFDLPRPALFSYNSPLGACGECRGFGRVIRVDWNKVIPDPKKSLKDGAIKAWMGTSAEWERKELFKFAKRRNIPIDVPWEKLKKADRELVIEGEGHWDDGKFPGVKRWFKWLESRTYKMHVRVFLARYREYAPCEACGGSRLNDTARMYHVAGLGLGGWHGLTVEEARARLDAFTPRDPQGARVKEALLSRLRYLSLVGLSYLTLDRQSRTLSGGEAQRAALTTALGASLTGSLFVLDEPTVGLHALDIPPLTYAMRELSVAGNTVLVIEHDEAVVRSADRVVELGEGAGAHGGRVLFDGTPAELGKKSHLPTAKAWARAFDKPRTPRELGASMHVRGARANNLKSVDVKIPLGVLTVLTGPSGSGKSTLAEEVLYRTVARSLGDTSVERAGEVDQITGIERLSGVELVDQSPLGRTARGNAATYSKAWDRIRARFSAEPDAIRRGLTPAHFSFNVADKGRCETCAGEGFETIEMQFLADVQLLCPVCQGKRFRPEVLAVKHCGLTVADVLALSVEEVLAAFDHKENRDYVLARALSPLIRLGLGYLPLGQPLSTLSGGEAQRLKLARALSEKAKNTLFVIDEPSAGLHGEDVTHVISALHSLVEDGATVVVVEHDLDIIRAADWVIDLGPAGGPEGGAIVATGTPAQLTKAATKTGEALRAVHVSAPVKGKKSATAKVDSISVKHAREHNLKNISCEIPHSQLTVVTGPSGSGKSSLAFDVVFAEGQRRFMETLSPYARQFLPTLPRPNVDLVTGVPPSIALEQRTTRGGANSTVATVTEIAHYLRLLYAKVGDVHCPKCDSLVEATSPDELYESLTASRDSTKHTVYSPAVRARKGTYLDLFTQASRAGIQTARVDGAIVAIDPPPKLVKAKEHSIDLIVYYGALRDLPRNVFDRAIDWAEGSLSIAKAAPSAKPHATERIVSTARTCSNCGTAVPELDPRWFSFNTKQGQCESCEGTGVKGGPSAMHEAHESGSPTVKCPACNGSRLAKVPRSVRLQGEQYAQFTARSVSSALASARKWRFSGRSAEIAKAAWSELLRRLQFVEDVGLGYLGLDRAAQGLSGGEMQRLRLSAQLGSGLTGALYVLDEPTIGLHPRDTGKLLSNLHALVETGSTVVVVEHDAEMILSADHIVDLGPHGGRGGGEILASGSAKKVLASAKSSTAQALKEAPPSPSKAPEPKKFIELTGATHNNLKNVNLRLGVGVMNVICGVSGSGKSTLVERVFFPALRKELGLVTPPPGAFKSIKGANAVKRALLVDQSPIGRTPRSVPATFLGIWDDIRKVFAALPEAKMQGFSPARFSFNTGSGGRCPGCEGQGLVVSEMSFLPDVVSPCETCGGDRFERSTLDVRYKGLSIGDVLRLSAEEAAEFFSVHPRIARPLATLTDLGVGYVQLGQASNTLSGGEAQRLKLAAELTAGSHHEPTLYVLDEPTTGLHLSDVRRLVRVLRRLVDRGDTLAIIEHHPDVIRAADWVVELGPEAGEAGGHIVYEGNASGLSKAKTATGIYLRQKGDSLRVGHTHAD